MAVPVTSSAHCYTVELRFFGDDLDPDAITSALALSPSIVNSLRAPLPVGGGGRYGI